MLFGERLGRRRGGRPALLLAVLACLVALAPAAKAEEFTVTSTGDQVDAALGDEFCTTASEGCTLRAAIEESNALEESARIEFAEGTFGGQGTATIAIGSSLPPVTVRTFINGRTCETEAGVSGPCVGINGQSGEPALTFEGAANSEIWGLAITDAQTALSLDESTRFKAQASWFGVGLDGSPGANGSGILVGPGSDKALIGSEGAERRNVIGESTGDGLAIHGASEVRVLGNYFGVAPDGVTPAANGGDDIEVTALGGIEASDTEIGTKVRAEGVATPECDLGCNVISAAGANAIDLKGDGGEEAAASATAIRGNYIGPDATGAAVLANAAAGVRVGAAAQTVIGGHQPGEGNRINGGSVAVEAGPKASTLVIYGNAIGTDASGTATVAPPEEGIVVESGSLGSAALEARIVDNRVRMQGGLGIVQQGFGATIVGNEINGADTGIQTLGSAGKRGNLIENNTIEATPNAGILLENNLNEVFGNAIDGAGVGVWVIGSGTFGVRENTIGGDTPAEENVIDGSAGAAIQVTNPENSNNAIGRNRGSSNGGLFIDLIAAEPETEAGWPNHSIAPPTFVAAEQLAVGGGAEPGATVRVFRKASAAAGELGPFLGQTVADGEGEWSLFYSEPLAASTIVAATQTSEAGGTSELSIAVTAGESGGGASEESSSGEVAPVTAGSSSSAPLDTVRPQTKIAKGPRRRSRRRTARFVFYSNEPGATFQCRLDRRRWRRCRSPKTFRHLSFGKHVFRVRAVDRAGNVDRSAAKRRFFVTQRNFKRRSRRHVRR